MDVFDAGTDGEGLRIGVVQARFNEPVCTALREACLERLTRLGVSDEDIFVCSVPGALEIPLALQKLAQHPGLVVVRVASAIHAQLSRPACPGFSVSPTSLSFDNLNAGNNYTDTKATTIETTTNAYGGYIVRLAATDYLRNGSLTRAEQG